MTETKKLPVLPLRDIVVFPNMVAPLFVGREKSVRALDVVEDGGNEIMLIAQRDAAIDEPTDSDLYSVGTIATILQLLKLPDGTVKVLVEGKSRARMVGLEDRGDFFTHQNVLVAEDAIFVLRLSIGMVVKDYFCK